MSTFISCTCFDNPLCTKCEGRGYYHSNERDAKSVSLDTNGSGNHYKSSRISPTAQSSKRKENKPIVEKVFGSLGQKPNRVCPYCSAIVGRSKFNKHIKSKCPKADKSALSDIKNISKGKKKQKKGKHTSNRHSFNLPNTNSVVPSYRSESKMDGSYGFHVAREFNGRFGSYPSHDNYHNDSMP